MGKCIADGIIDNEMRWDGYLEGLQIDTGNPEGWVEGKKEKDRIRAEINREYLTQIETGMDQPFPKLLNEFETLKVSDRNGVPYPDYIQNIMRPISHMTWFKEKSVPNEVYEREISVMEEEKADIQNRIEDSLSVREQKAYKDLLSYSDQREETLNLFFDKPLSDTLKAKFKGFVNGKLR